MYTEKYTNIVYISIHASTCIISKVNRPPNNALKTANLKQFLFFRWIIMTRWQGANDVA